MGRSDGNDGTVRAVMALPRQQGVLNMTGTRFAVMGSDGVYVAARNAGGVTAIRMDSRAVETAEATADAGDRIYAVAGGDLVTAGEKSSRLSTLLRAAELPVRKVHTMAYDARRGELWLSGEDKTAVVNIDHATVYTRDEVLRGQSKEGMVTMADGSLATLASEDCGEGTRVSYSTVLQTKAKGYGRVRSVAVDVHSSRVDGLTVTVERLNHDKSEPKPSLRATIDGAVLHPTVLHAAPRGMMPARAVRVTVEGQVSADTTMVRGAEIKTD